MRHLLLIALLLAGCATRPTPPKGLPTPPGAVNRLPSKTIIMPDHFTPQPMLLVWHGELPTGAQWVIDGWETVTNDFVRLGVTTNLFFNITNDAPMMFYRVGAEWK